MKHKKQFLLLMCATVFLYLIRGHILIYQMGLTLLQNIPYFFKIMFFSNEALITTINGVKVELITRTNTNSLHHGVWLTMIASLIIGLLDSNNIMPKFINFAKDGLYKIWFDYIPNKNLAIKILVGTIHAISLPVIISMYIFIDGGLFVMIVFPMSIGNYIRSVVQIREIS